MTAGKLTGSASISFEQPIYIESAASITGKKKEKARWDTFFDMVSQDLSLEQKHGKQQKALFRRKPLFWL